MDSEEKVEGIDHLLDLLSMPISRYILSVLAGVDPGTFKMPVEGTDDTSSAKGNNH